METKNKWKTFWIFMGSLVLICGVLFILGGMMNSQKIPETHQIQDAVINAAVLAMEAGVSPETYDMDTPFTQKAKAAASAEFAAELATAFTADSPYRTSFAQSKSGTLDAVGQTNDITIEVGVSVSAINNIDLIDDNHAIVSAVTGTWRKVITKDQNGAYIVTVPENTDTQTIELAKEDDVWKVAEYLDTQKEFTEDDSLTPESLQHQYDSYSAAVAAAKAYKPRYSAE